MLKAFCRVAPSDRFNFLAIFPAGVFLRAIVFISRTSVGVHDRRFLPFFIGISLYDRRGACNYKSIQRKGQCFPGVLSASQFASAITAEWRTRMEALFATTRRQRRLSASVQLVPEPNVKSANRRRGYV